MYTSKLSLPVTCISFGEIDDYGMGLLFLVYFSLIVKLNLRGWCDILY